VDKKLDYTADQLRNSVGVGSVLKVGNGTHEGITKRPTETATERRTEDQTTEKPPESASKGVFLDSDGDKRYQIGGKLVTKEEYDNSF
jgi:hypothetical protein